MATTPDQKPSAEIQAIVMNLWNVIRETAQATTAIHAENKAFAQKHHALNEQILQEHERQAKLQAYTEHLQTELKQQQHDLDTLQPRYQEAFDNSQKHEETIQELRRILLEQEDLVARRGEENKMLSEQLLVGNEGFDAERERLHTSLEALKHDLTASRQQSLNVATEVDELRNEVEALSTERDKLLDDNEQLRWRLEAFEKNSTQEYTEVERKLETARVYSGEVTVQLEDAKRLMSESDARIIALTAERNSLRDTVGSAEQEALTWQQIAEEQTETLQRLQTVEQEYKILLEKSREEYAANLAAQLTINQNLSETALAALKVQLEEERTLHQQTLEIHSKEREQITQLMSSKNLYETALETLKAQLQEERMQHQQTLAAHATEHEQTLMAQEEQMTKMKAEFDKQVVELRKNMLQIPENERLALTEKVAHLLQRVEAALAD
jgi:predicted  nucleic acid-binding Zn-ribbon protein